MESNMKYNLEFNLITAQWIPVLRRSGREERLAPWQITSAHDQDPVILLKAPRPDFNGALIQFLIGLVQTVAPPEDEDEWEDLFDTPPAPNTLKQAFLKVSHAFELGGDGARFMQDIDQLDGEDWDIGRLLIDAPANEHFIKPGGVNGLCPSCCTTALFAMQTNAPAGGVGHRTSLRGGGPLTTLVLSDTGNADSLWRTIWLNVLERDSFLRNYGNSHKNAEADIFPWMARTRTSEKNTGCNTTPLDVHPFQMYWGMPRRIRLNLDNVDSGICDICSLTSGQLINSYHSKNYGISYVGPWLHPLTPHSRDKKNANAPMPVHAQPGGVTYRHWLGFVQEDERAKRKPAQVVHLFRSQRQNCDWRFRLWAFGYDMENMKARCWYEGTIPLLSLNTEIREEYERQVASIVTAASQVASNLRTCTKKAWFKRPSDVKGDTGFIDNSFWQKTEADFYQTLHSLKSALEEGGNAADIRRGWHECLCRTSQTLFDKLAWDGPIEDADPKRIVLARRDLRKMNHSKKIKTELLELPKA